MTLTSHHILYYYFCYEYRVACVFMKLSLTMLCITLATPYSARKLKALNRFYQCTGGYSKNHGTNYRFVCTHLNAFSRWIQIRQWKFEISKFFEKSLTILVCRLRSTYACKRLSDHVIFDGVVVNGLPLRVIIVCQ